MFYYKVDVICVFCFSTAQGRGFHNDIGDDSNNIYMDNIDRSIRPLGFHLNMLRRKLKREITACCLERCHSLNMLAALLFLCTAIHTSQYVYIDIILYAMNFHAFDK